MISYVDYDYKRNKYILFNEHEYRNDILSLSEIQFNRSDIILTDKTEIYNHYLSKTNNVNYLANYLGFQNNENLFEIFSYYYMGKAQSDFDMLQALYNGVINNNQKICYVLKIGVSFAWFTVLPRELNILGVSQFSEVENKYTVGKFIKKIKYSMALSGVNTLRNIRYLVWNNDDVSGEFINYMRGYSKLEDFFYKIQGLKNLSLENILYLLKHNIQKKVIPTAQSTVEALNDSFRALGIYEDNGVLYSKNIYYKDFSSCKSLIIDYNKCEYGIILDCEGVSGSDGSLANGISELGGIIFCKYENIMLNIETFYCDRLILLETLQQVINKFGEISGKHVNKINTYTYGIADEKMLKSSISKQKLLNKFNFIDTKVDIDEYINVHDIKVEGKKTLSNIAKALGVLPLFPKHNPVNDSRTLFNILAEMLYSKRI